MKQIFESEKIAFVKVNEELISDYLKMVNDIENVTYYIGERRTPYSYEEEKKWVQNNIEKDSPLFSMIEKRSGEFIGNIELMNMNEKSAELGIAITASKQNQHYGTEAIQRMIEYSFHDLKLDKIYLKAFVYNKRAIHVYEKCGFVIVEKHDKDILMERINDKKSDRKIIFVRHGQDDKRYRGGWSQLDLTCEGRKQAEKLAAYLKEKKDDYQISKIMSSDLQRAKTTANMISSQLQIPVVEDARIREINNGDLAGMLNEEAQLRYPGLYFSSLAMDEAYPNGESPREFYLRIQNWFEKLIQDQNENILVVTHSGVINIIYYLVMNKDWSNASVSYPINCCSLHLLNVKEMKFEIQNMTDFLY